MSKGFLALVAALLTLLGINIASAATACKPTSKPAVTQTAAVKTKPNGAYYSLSYDEYNEICRVVMGESGGESYEGQLAVAQTILNTCLIEHRRPLDVIKAKKYTTWRPTPSESVKQAVLEVFTDGRTVLDKRVTIFYSPANIKSGYSKYHESQTYSCTIGGHRFFIEHRYADVIL